MSAKILLFLGLLYVADQASSGAIVKPQSSSNGLFSSELFKHMSKANPNENVIVSPLSIQTAMAMAFMGSEGETASELQKGLQLSSINKEAVGQEFLDLISSNKGEVLLNVANKIYIRSGNKLRSTYNDLLSKYFNSEAETVNFANPETIENINNWVAKATSDKITKIMQPGDLNLAQSAVILNAIYFKGFWEKPFDPSSYRFVPFLISKTQKKRIKAMYQVNNFMYGEFPEWDAQAIELPYKNSDLSMLIILPQVDGLSKLEEQLQAIPLNELSSRMEVKNVTLFLPKFKIEFGTVLTDALQSMGMKTIFGNNADLSGIFETGMPLQISDVRHKAFIQISDVGTEAAAVTATDGRANFVKAEKIFLANRPFVFAIKSPETVYFVGHYVKPDASVMHT